jgi:hypothetical protein
LSLLQIFRVEPARIIESNKLLENPEIFLKGQVQGPEHLLEKDGIWYTSTGNGDVVRIDGENVEVLSKFGKFCCKYKNEI